DTRTRDSRRGDASPATVPRAGPGALGRGRAPGPAVRPGRGARAPLATPAVSPAGVTMVEWTCLRGRVPKAHAGPAAGVPACGAGRPALPPRPCDLRLFSWSSA